MPATTIPPMDLNPPKKKSTGLKGLQVDHTYRIRFFTQGTPESLVHEAIWKVRDVRGESAAALRAYVMRWTKSGRHFGVVKDITDDIVGSTRP